MQISKTLSSWFLLLKLDKPMTKMNNETFFEFVNDGFPDDLVRFKGTNLSSDPRLYSEDLNNFEIHSDDVWLCGFMRSGTHWAKEMIWQVANNLHLESTEQLRDRFQCFDVLIPDYHYIHLTTPYDDILSQMNSLPSPRFFKAHLPFHLLPRRLRDGEKKAKMIYITRNPKDVCVSLYYYYKHFYNFKGNLEEMCDLLITDKVNYAPYWDNVLGYWQKRKDFNILFLKYEDMKNDLPSVVRKTADFFGINLTDEQIAALSAHLSFENYRQNPRLTDQNIDEIYTKWFNHKDTNGFVRKGTVDQWKQEMSADTVRRLDEWIEKNLQNSDYKI